MLLKCGDGDMMQVMTTLGVDYSAKNLAGPGQTTIRLNLWDVAGFLKNRSPSIPHICHFFTQAKILDRKFYTEERVNYGKRISRQNSVNCDLLAQANYTNYTLCVKLHTE